MLAVACGATVRQTGADPERSVNVALAVQDSRAKTLLHGEFALEQLPSTPNGTKGIAGNNE